MSIPKTSEVITVREALTRIHLEGLIPDGSMADHLIEWKGYPVPFACGHDAIRGFGPLDRESENDSKGKGRRYQEKCRVNQFWAGGAVLFSWGLVSVGISGDYYRINTGMVVCVDTPPDPNGNSDMVLKLGFTC